MRKSLSLFLFVILIMQSGFGQLSNVKKTSNETIEDFFKNWNDTTKHFPQTAFSKVVAYNFNKGRTKKYTGELLSIYDFNKKDIISRKDSVSFVLTGKQTETLLKIINDTLSFGWGESDCFIPHQAFVFYNENNIPVAIIDISLSCHQLSAIPHSPIIRFGGIDSYGWAKLYNLMDEIGLWVNY